MVKKQLRRIMVAYAAYMWMISDNNKKYQYDWKLMITIRPGIMVIILLLLVSDPGQRLLLVENAW